MNTRILRTKLFFTLTILFLIGVMSFGIYFIQYTKVFTAKNIERIYTYPLANLDFYFSDSNAFLARIGVINIYKTSPAEAINNSPAQDIPVLVYHGIVDKADRFSITSKTFEDQMFTLKRAGYHTISIQDFNDFKKGKKAIDNKAFLLTFDDGRTDSFYGADPILKVVGFEAVMFIATNDSLNPARAGYYYLDERDIKKMVTSGRWEIQSHAIQADGVGGLIPIDNVGTKGNFLSNKMWLDTKGRLETDDEYRSRITRELGDSKKQIEEITGKSVIAFSYPFGDYGQQTLNYPKAESVIASLVDSDYSLAFHQTWPIDNNFTSNFKDTDPYHLVRIESGTTWTGEYLVRLMASVSAKNIPYTDNLTTDNGWKKNWGLIGMADNGVNIKATPISTGAFGFLDGTHDWRNYIYTANIDWEKGSYVSLIARFQDSDNYVSCTFSNDLVKIEKKINGNIDVVKSVKNPVTIPRQDSTLAVIVNGSSIQCLAGSSVVISDESIDNSLAYGGIGLRTWDPLVDNASVTIKYVRVSPISDVEKVISELPDYLK